jgi:LPS sulfotransferase NodH
VLHVVRRNDLATLVSLHRAESTGRWLSASSVGLAAVEVTPQECEEAFRQTRAWRDDLTATFPAGRVHEVAYEDLAADTATVMSGVQRFLGLEVHDLEPGSVRQASGSTADAVANYPELEAHFSGTRWEEWIGA